MSNSTGSRQWSHGVAYDPDQIRDAIAPASDGPSSSALADADGKIEMSDLFVTMVSAPRMPSLRPRFAARHPLRLAPPLLS